MDKCKIQNYRVWKKRGVLLGIPDNHHPNFAF